MERLFEPDDAPRRPHRRAGAATSRWPRGCARRRSTSSWARSTCSGAGRRCAPRSRRAAPHSMILYGPPGTGKTTLARLLAGTRARAFEEASAVEAGRAEVREVIERAAAPAHHGGEPTIFFLDEIHRFNKAQQDALLPAVEEGLAARWSGRPPRTRTSRSTRRCSRAPGSTSCRAARRARAGAAAPRAGRRARHRRAAARWTTPRSSSSPRARAATRARRWPRWSWPARRRAPTAAVTLAHAEDALQRKAVLYDKDGDRHYDTISAWIKATRGSDPDASLLYLAGDARGRRGPALHRPADGRAGQRGHRQRRPAGAAGGRGRGARGGARRHARGRAQPGPGGGLPGAGAEVERLVQGHRPRPRWVREHGAPDPPTHLR